MKVIGLEIRHVGKEFIRVLILEGSIREGGIMIYSMDRDKRNGKMEAHLKGTFKMGKRMELAYRNGQMHHHMLVSGEKI